MPSFDAAEPPRMDRRRAIKWMMTAAASTALIDQRLFGPDSRVGAAVPPPSGYDTDPDLLKTYQPGDLWPLTFNAAQRATAAVLCDTIIPADPKGPSASSVRVHDFIDEWVSAPYPAHAEDRRIVLEGLTWLDAESQKRFGNAFVNLIVRQRNSICDDICYLPNANPAFRGGARFFRRYRDLTAGGYYTTPEGMKDIGYIGNVPLEKYEGPPPEVLQRLGLTLA